MEFIEQHSSVVLIALSGSAAAIGGLVTILFQLYTRHNDEHQTRQDVRLASLEDWRTESSGEHGRHKSEIGALNEHFATLLDELRREREDRRKALGEERRQRERLEEKNSAEHLKIEGLIKRYGETPSVANA